MQCARQGFALGLTLLIGKISSVKVDSLLKLIVDSLEISSSMKGQVSKKSFQEVFGTAKDIIITFFNCITGSKGLFVRAIICLWCSSSIRKAKRRVDL